jgi:Asp-tRNA(Asn)/Glu-tRNA(Gln) amidotransferase B subunit
LQYLYQSEGVTDNVSVDKDTAKSHHDLDTDFNAIDLNRANVGLLEIVSEPDIE